VSDVDRRKFVGLRTRPSAGARPACWRAGPRPRAGRYPPARARGRSIPTDPPGARYRRSALRSPSPPPRACAGESPGGNLPGPRRIDPLRATRTAGRSKGAADEGDRGASIVSLAVVRTHLRRSRPSTTRSRTSTAARSSTTAGRRAAAYQSYSTPTTRRPSRCGRSPRLAMGTTSSAPAATRTASSTCRPTRPSTPPWSNSTPPTAGKTSSGASSPSTRRRTLHSNHPAVSNQICL
jgi:hypothetical protein